MNIARKSLTAALGAAVVAGGALASTGAEAGHRHHRDRSGAVVAGIIGGLAVGALAVAASRPSRAYADSHYYPSGGYYPSSGYHPSAGYYPAQSGYLPATSWRDGHGYQPVRECFKERRAVFDQWGNYVGAQKVRICR